MKISKTFIAVLFLGIIAIGAVTLYSLWQKEVDRRDSQNAALAAEQALLPPIQANIVSAQADLKAAQAKIAVAKANLDAYKAKFPDPPPAAAIQSIDYASKLFIMAANNSLDLSEFQATDASITTIGGITYQQTQMNISISGLIQDINNFIGNLETNSLYSTATIDSVNITFYSEVDPDLGAVPPPDAAITITLMALEG